MGKLNSVLFDRYTLTLNHEYEFENDGKISRVKADEPICVTFTTPFMGGASIPISIGKAMNMIEDELLKRMTEE